MGAPSCGFSLPTLGFCDTSLIDNVGALEFCCNAAMRLASASDFALGMGCVVAVVDAVDEEGGSGGGAALSHRLFSAAILSAIDITIGSESSPLITKRCLGA